MKTYIMETVIMKILKKTIIPAVLIFLTVLLLPSCATNMVFKNSTVVPSANGVVKVTKDRNKNYVIQIRINDLAEVDRLEGSKLTYVVWMVSENEKTENIGQLRSERTFITNKLKATLKTVSPSKPKKVFITDENDGNAQYPIGKVVISTNSD